MKRLSTKIISSVFILSSLFSVVAAPKAHADEYDAKIAQQQAILEQIKKEQSVQTDALNAINAEIAGVETEIANVQTELANKQREIETLTAEMTVLEDLIEKRTQKINEQARQLQVTDTTQSMIDAILSSESIVEAFTKIMAMVELTNSSQEMLAKQKADKDALALKRQQTEEAALAFAAKSTELTNLKDSLLQKTIQAQITLTELAAEATSAQDNINSLKQQQAQAQEALRLAREEAARKAAEQARASQIVASVKQQQPVTLNSGGVSASGFTYPIASPSITSPFGVARSIGAYADIHNGVDFVNGNSAAPIMSVADGVVIFAGTDAFGGLGVIIKHANGLYTYYWHLSSMSVSIGRTVVQGQVLGIIGTTGMSTGIHLHFGVSTALWSNYVNPMNYLP